MLNSLYIKNFRNLEELTIESLGRVNLITGKNNTGKSSVLEAVALWVTDGNLHLLSRMIYDRGEFIEGDYTNPIQSNIKSFSSIFTNRHVGYDLKDSIRIGTSPTNSLSLKFSKHQHKDFFKETNDPIYDQRELISFESFNHAEKRMRGLHIEEVLPIEQYLNLEFSEFKFVSSQQINRLNDDNLFDNIALTEKEQYVIDALRIIEPKTQRIAFVQQNGHRKAVIKLKDTSEVLPLQGMGDGINRILTIILALVNCEKGYLLIDEFENGLHHTVQEQLWRVIFYLAEKLDIQIFATTHSWDCIAAYENVLNDEEIKTDGKLIRLEHKNDKIRAVAYRKSQLKSATDFGIEVR